MKLLFDENFERAVARHFNSIGHDVVHVGEDESGTDDEELVKEFGARLNKSFTAIDQRGVRIHLK